MKYRPPYYGHEVAAALEEMGYTVSSRPKFKPEKGDVLVTWNRYARDEPFCQKYEAAGGRVLVMENGYFGRNFNGSEWFALSRRHHNGAGWWKHDPGRRIDVELKPWKLDGSEVVVLASRGMGNPKLREPDGWSDSIAETLETDRVVRVRRHPGKQADCKNEELESDLENAWCAVTWGSSAGLKALTMGIPVFYGFSKWIGGSAARRLNRDIEFRLIGDRESMLNDVACAMWSLEEIKTGEPFRNLLGDG